MKSFFITLALIGFSGVTLFGAFLMVHSGDTESHANCLPTLMGTSECKTSINPLEYARVHLGALAELTNIIPASSALTVSAMLIVLLYAVSVFGSHRQFLPLQRGHAPLHRERRRQVVQEKFLKWTALHEKRDPSPAFAASTRGR